MKLIDKSAVVAEIDKQGTIQPQLSWFTDKLIQKIFSLEVKEVNLKEELDNWRHQHFHGKRDKEASGEYFTRGSQLDFAKYFFELGLKQSSTDEFRLGEAEIYLEDDGGEPPYDGKQWLDLSCKEYEIPFGKFKDGDKIEIFIRKVKKGE